MSPRGGLFERLKGRVRNYAPRGFSDARSCGAFYDARAMMFRKDPHTQLEYTTPDVQTKLFERVISALPPRGRVLDFGCGLGHLLDFLDERHLSPAAYHGIDVSQAMIRQCEERIGSRHGVSVEWRDITGSPLTEGSYDVGYAISVLGYPIGKDPLAWMMGVLENLLSACSEGIALTHLAAGRKPGLVFTTDPEELAARCERTFDVTAGIEDNGSFTYVLSLRHPGAS